MRLFDEQDALNAAVIPSLDESQLRVVNADLTRSLAVLGAPGSGKTETLLAVYRAAVCDRGFAPHEVIILGANRLVASRLRRRADALVQAVSSGTRVRTSSSLALAVLSAARRVQGEKPLRLLTGAVQDELIDAVVDALPPSPGATLSSDIIASAAFRNQLRELMRMMDDHRITPAKLSALAERYGVPEWAESAVLVTEYRALAEREYPLSSDTSSLHAMAVALLEALPVGGEAQQVLGDFADLKLILVDDAQELTDSALFLLRSFARRGVAIWAFGDPDLSTGAFHGAAHRALSQLASVLGTPTSETITLSSVYRHGGAIRDTVAQLTEHLGTAGLGQQRNAASVRSGPSVVRFAEFSGLGESAGAIAHLLRERHLGLNLGGAGIPQAETHASDSGVPWSQMAVLCRTRAEARMIARQLAAAEVPTTVAAGGMVLSEHPLAVSLLRLTQLVFGWRSVDVQAVSELATGPLGGLDAVGLNRFRETAQLEDARSGQQRTADEIVVSEFLEPMHDSVIDSRQSRALKRLAGTYAAGLRARHAGGDLSEVLWALWDAAGIATNLERLAVSGTGVVAESANEALDAVLALFFSVRRHEEQEVDRDRQAFVETLLDSSLPEDSLVRSGQADAVTVTTPQGMIGANARIVVVTQLQEGVWPNLKPRGSLLRLDWLTDILQGREPLLSRERRDVLHDELRMLVFAVSRASDELLISAIRNDDTSPSAFFAGLAPEHLAVLPSSRLTLRGRVAALRRHLTEHPEDERAAQELAILAAAGVDGADPEHWYGILPPSSDEPLSKHDDEDARVSVSPSRLATFEGCPLNWAISRLGGDTAVSAAAIGTLVHLAMERSEDSSIDAIMARIDAGWAVLSFDSVWEQARTRKTVQKMAEAVAAYLEDFAQEQATLFAAEQTFTFDVGRARVRGAIDRIELHPSEGEPARVLVVDLKTQRTPPTAAELADHVQLAMYQLAVHENALELPDGAPAGAALLLVHPQATGSRAYRLAVQDPLSVEQREALIQRIVSASEGMTASAFTANVEQHCTDPYAFGSCSMHIVRPVSFG